MLLPQADQGYCKGGSWRPGVHSLQLPISLGLHSNVATNKGRYGCFPAIDRRSDRELELLKGSNDADNLLLSTQKAFTDSPKMAEANRIHEWAQILCLLLATDALTSI